MDFRDLECWKRCRALRISVRNFTKSLPHDEKYKLIDQMVRASRSTTANIAEGHGRFHHQENIQYCRQSRGSLTELIDHFTVALDENYISEEHFNMYIKEIEECIKMVNGYIRYLKKRKDNDK